MEYISKDLYRNLIIAEHQAEGLIEGATYINRSQEKTYDVSHFKKVLKAIRKAKEQL